MRIEFIEEITLALCKSLDGRITKNRCCKSGEIHRVEFLGEDSNLETISFQFKDGLFALKVPRFTVHVKSSSN